MKLKILFLTIAGLTFVFLFPAYFDSAVNGQRPARFKTETGAVSLGTGQKMIVSISVDPTTDTPERFRFRMMRYGQTQCQANGVCRQTVESQNTTPLLTMNPNESLSFEIDGNGNLVSAEVLGSTRNMRVNVMIIDTATGKITAVDVPPIDINLLG